MNLLRLLSTKPYPNYEPLLSIKEDVTISQILKIGWSSINQ